CRSGPPPPPRTKRGCRARRPPCRTADRDCPAGPDRNSPPGLRTTGRPLSGRDLSGAPRATDGSCHKEGRPRRAHTRPTAPDRPRTAGDGGAPGGATGGQTFGPRRGHGVGRPAPGIGDRAATGQRRAGATRPGTAQGPGVGAAGPGTSGLAGATGPDATGPGTTGRRARGLSRGAAGPGVAGLGAAGVGV